MNTKVNFKIYRGDHLVTTINTVTINLWDIAWTWKALIASNKDRDTKIIVEVVEDDKTMANYIHNELIKQLQVIGY